MIKKIVLLFVLGAAFFSLNTSLALAGDDYKPVASYSKASGFNNYEICASAIAALMGRPVNIMEVKNIGAEVFIIKYIRPSDGSVWTNKCKVDGSRIIWGATDGRWRTHSADSKLQYEVKNSNLTITERWPDGSIIENTYSKSDFIK